MNENKRYNLVVCSYAMHLAEDGLLTSLVMLLSQSTDLLLILSPHKRPEIR